MSHVERMAQWVCDLRYQDVPQRVLDMAKYQVMSVLGAVWAGERIDGGRKVSESVSRWAGEGPCTSLPGGGRMTLPGAIMNNCSLSMALDYDDYLFLGHTGHSAVLAPWAVGEYCGADTRDILLAQVIANELGGRVGASVFMGPHNGQMWVDIHHVGAAAATAKLLELDWRATANAIGISLAEPIYALYPGFLEPQSKLLAASFPTLTGVLSGLFAGEGMTGSPSILEDPQGFWKHFAYVPLPFMMTGLGESWVTDTLAFKVYPGCAYIDTTIDALLEIMEGYRKRNGKELSADEVTAVDVEAGMLTTVMEELSNSYLRSDRLSPTNINFSIGISVAICLISGELSPSQLEESVLEEGSERIREIASRVTLEHDLGFTVEMLVAIDEVVDLGAMMAQIDLKELLGSRARFREGLSGIGISLSELRNARKGLSEEERRFLRSLISLRRRRQCRRSGYDLGSRRLEELEFPFGARVTVRLKDGSSMTAEQRIPRGGAGDPGRGDAAREKFLRETSRTLGAEGSKRAVGLVESFEEHTLKEVIDSLAAGDMT